MDFIRRRWKLIVSFAILAASIAFVSQSQSIRFAEIWAAMARFSLLTIAGGFALAIVQVLAQGSRLWSLLPGVKGNPRWSFVLRSFSLGQLVNNYVPARAGDLVKIAALRDQDTDESPAENKMHTATAAGSVLIADKVVDILALALIALPFASKLISEFGFPNSVKAAFQSNWSYAAVAGLGIGSVTVAWQIRSRLAAGGLPAWLLNFGRGSAGLLVPHRLGGGLVFSGLSWLSEATIAIMLARTLGFDLTLAQGVWVLLILNLGIAIPVSFANIGTFEASMVFGLSQFGIPVPEALAVSVIHHALQMVSVAAVAAFFWIGPWGKKSMRTDGFRVRAKDKERAHQYFESKSREYNDNVARGPLRVLRERERGAVMRLATPGFVAGKSMIDVGCGGGIYSLAGKRAGMRVCSVDLSEGMVASIRDKVDEARVLDIEKPEDSKGSYDLVICSGVLDFVLNPETAFRNLAGMVAPGGRMVILVPRKGPGGLIYRLEKRFSKISVNLYSEEWFSRLSRQLDLEISKIERPLPYNMVLALERPVR